MYIMDKTSLMLWYFLEEVKEEGLLIALNNLKQNKPHHSMYLVREQEGFLSLFSILYTGTENSSSHAAVTTRLL